MDKLIGKLKSLNRDFVLFLFVGAFVGIGQSVDQSTLTNFLKDKLDLTILQRTMLEFPRELPGFLVVLIIGFLYAFGDIRIAALANVLAAVGMFSLGVVPNNFIIIIFCMFIYSMGAHIFMPLSNSIGMSFANDANLGRRLGQFNSANTAALVVGSAILWLLFEFVNLSFTASFAIGAAAFLGASVLLMLMNPTQTKKVTKRFIYRKEYRVFYWLSLLYGARKQIFITFGPWVLVSVFKQKVTTMTILFFIVAVLGIAFKPFVGYLIDKVGEKAVLAGEAVMLLFVCLGYTFADNILPGSGAIYIVSACYITDQLLTAAGMARATYLKKIIVKEDDLMPTLSAGISIDHIISMTVPFFGGFIWYSTGQTGYKYVFLGGAFIALVNLISTRLIKIPKQAGSGVNE